MMSQAYTPREPTLRLDTQPSNCVHSNGVQPSFEHAAAATVVANASTPIRDESSARGGLGLASQTLCTAVDDMLPSWENAGFVLARARKAMVMDVQDLAWYLKVPPKYVVALEAGAVDALPDLVFARALAARACNYLGADRDAFERVCPKPENPNKLKSVPSISLLRAIPVISSLPQASSFTVILLLALCLGLGGAAWRWGHLISDLKPLGVEQKHAGVATQVIKGSALSTSAGR